MPYVAINLHYFRDPYWASEQFSEPQAYLDLLTSAEFTRNTRYSRSKKRFDLKRGERFTTKSHLKKRWKVGHNLLHEWLNGWKERGWIDYTEDRKHGIVIKLLNYDEFICDFSNESQAEEADREEVPASAYFSGPSQTLPAETRIPEDKVYKESKVFKELKEAEVPKVPKANKEPMEEEGAEDSRNDQQSSYSGNNALFV